MKAKCEPWRSVSGLAAALVLLILFADAQARSEGELAIVEAWQEGVLVDPSAGYDLSVTIVGNGKRYQGVAVQQGSYIGENLPDGLYKYELTVILPTRRVQDPEGDTVESNTDANGRSLDLYESSDPEIAETTQTGTFRLVGGREPQYMED